MSMTAIKFDLEEIGKYSDEQLCEFVNRYGGIKQAAAAIGEAFATNGEMHIDTATIVNWLNSRIRTACQVHPSVSKMD